MAEIDEKKELALLRDITKDMGAEIERLRAALVDAICVAHEACEEWDKAPEGMKAGKLLVALSGELTGYRADIDAIHAALKPTSVSETVEMGK